MKKLIPIVTAVLALTGASTSSRAATELGEYFTLAGFGTLGAVRVDTDEGRFVKDRQGKGGAGRSADFSVDSNLGLQLTGTATSWLSGTVQMLASKRDESYIEPDIEWAFVTVKPLDGLSVRVGRIAPPVFANSDARNIGYANNWVRVPNEVYALNLYRRLNGLDVTYSRNVGPVELSATVFGGSAPFKAFSVYPGTGEDMKGVNLVASSEWVSVRLGYMKTTNVIPDLTPPGRAVAHDPYTFSGVGATVDRNNIYLQGEYVKRKSALNPLTVDLVGWYLIGGYRFGQVLPYVIRAHAGPPDLPGSAVVHQSTSAVGLRWDAFQSAALKFQVDRIDTSNTKGFFLTPSTPPKLAGGPAGSKPVTKPVVAISASVDFVF